MKNHRPKNISVVEWLLKRIYLPTVDGCWLWQGPLGRGGYAHASTSKSQKHYVHRVFYEHFVGPIPAGKQLDHLCRVRHCVNPAHLEPVTSRENILRGVGVAAINAPKTHCKRGHEFTLENTYKVPCGRSCIACTKERSRRHYLKSLQNA